MHKNEIRVGIAGLGTVGVGVFKILASKAENIKNKTGAKVLITAISARDKNKDRDINIDNLLWFENPIELAKSENIDVFVELIGGSEGVAYEAVKTALENGKNVVTANKALIAKHGVELAVLAEKNNLQLLFEASVAGGIPVIKAIKESLSGNNINKITGILNGTCNYILSQMSSSGRDFGIILKDAQKLGYAESDPSFDIDGIDAAHKLAILTSLAFGIKPDFNSIFIEGIRGISQRDIKYAQKFNYNIKLLGICSLNSQSQIEQRVHPCLIANNIDISRIDGVTGAVRIENDNLGNLFLSGAGAGMLPTASAVVSDICDIVANRKTFSFGVPTHQLQTGNFAEISEHEGEYYIRLTVKDMDGVLMNVSQIFTKHSIGIEKIYQDTPEEGKADIVFITHDELEKDIRDAVKEIAKLPFIIGKPVVIRCEK
jgi:homoserine dehydrogenase